MRNYAFLARYGHQQIPLLMGRPMTFVEMFLFHKALRDLIRNEPSFRIG